LVVFLDTIGKWFTWSFECMVNFDLWLGHLSLTLYSSIHTYVAQSLSIWICFKVFKKYYIIIALRWIFNFYFLFILFVSTSMRHAKHFFYMPELAGRDGAVRLVLKWETLDARSGQLLYRTACFESTTL
jgi:hypothetical protein